MQTAPQLRIGLLNDLHYDGGVEAMNRLYEAVGALNRSGAAHLVVLGDLIDATGGSNAARLLREVAALCESFRGTVHYLPGNHDLDHLSKAGFYDALGCAEHESVFQFSVSGVVCLGLDGNFSPDGRPYENGRFEWQESFIPDDQLVWLKERLKEAAGPVLLFSHQRVDGTGVYAVRNHAAVREAIRASGKVKAVFQGHQHQDDLKQSEGTAYYTLAAHVDDAGPAVIQMDARGVRLIRDFQPMATAGSE